VHVPWSVDADSRDCDRPRLAAMPRLIHLNGPPGIGKSTLAQMYVDDHPGVLNLDIDHVLWLIGGWQDNVGESLTMARSIGLSMATTHLRSGHDVVLPQFTGRLNEIERFAAVAEESDALFCEILLMDTKERSVERFSQRSDAGETAWHRQVQEIVSRNGGDALLADFYDQLCAVIDTRSGCRVVRSEAGQTLMTYEALTAALYDVTLESDGSRH
jgi:predicted kinase